MYIITGVHRGIIITFKKELNVGSIWAHSNKFDSSLFLSYNNLKNNFYQMVVLKFKKNREFIFNIIHLPYIYDGIFEGYAMKLKHNIIPIWI